MTGVISFYSSYSSYCGSSESSRSKLSTPRAGSSQNVARNIETHRSATGKVAVNPTFYDDSSISGEPFYDLDSSSFCSTLSTIDSNLSGLADINVKPHIDPSRLYLDLQSQKDEYANMSTIQRRRKQLKKKAFTIGNQFLEMNAIIFGFGTQERLEFEAAKIWWDDLRIKYTVTEDFVTSNIPYVPGLKPSLRERLKLPVAFGAGLTDETYLDWIIHKSRRMFLILLHLGIPEQIFWIIDDAWDDADLPIPRKTVPRLALSYEPNEETDEKFWKMQYTFLLRGVCRQDHIDYEDHEVVPIEVLEKAHASGEYTTEKVVRPYGKRTQEFFTRVTVPVKEDLMQHVETVKSQNTKHANIVELFASYTFQDTGYLLYGPFLQTTLREFIRSPTYFIATMSTTDKRVLAFNWMIGLVSAVAFLHLKGIRHGDINPLSIYVMDGDSKLMLCDAGPALGTLDIFDRQGRSDIRDEYGAPEDYIDGTILAANPSEQQYLESDPAVLCRSDIFSLACVMIDILTFVSKLKVSTYLAHRRRSAELSRMSISSSSSLGSAASARTRISIGKSNRLSTTDHSSERPCSRGSASIRLPGSRRVSGVPSASGKAAQKLDVAFRANLPAVRSWCDALIEAAEEKDADGTGAAVVREIATLCCRGMLIENPRERIGSGVLVARLGMLADRLRKVLALSQAEKKE
ncbi:hypothetical protein DRE_01097 [Drechslerella stenobrocha 248]|uniref:Protein kinase domain-containing protein n=1 Tax=Drechslerella stenobrocha 248 TaxID=1043628 RepID=W7HJW9_9PEZI|nr:hypothetical protein DRE_01097 [Drechslerella stenobrocha 248]